VNQTKALDSADVVVVGAGISGLATAYELRKKGYDVVVVEQRFPAFGASGRHAGAIWLQLRRQGLELNLARAGLAKYDEYISEFGNTFRFRRNGGLFFFNTEEQGEVLSEYVQERKGAGLDIGLLNQKQARKASAALPDDAIGAVYCADDAQVDPQLLVSALASGCLRMGVRKYDNTAVLSTVRRGARLDAIRTVRGDIATSAVVWATGAWAVNLQSEGMELPIETVRQGQLVTQPLGITGSPIMHGPSGVGDCGALIELPGFKPELFASRRPASPGVRRSYEDTIALNDEGALYVGSTLDSYGSLNPHIGLSATTAMAELLQERYPERSDLGVTGLWAGLGCSTVDGLPIVDRFEQNFVNCAHSWGFASAPIGGQITAELLAGESNGFAAALVANRMTLAEKSTDSDTVATP